MNPLPEALRKAQEGEKIMLIYPDMRQAETAFRQMPDSATLNIQGLFARFPSGGVLAFRPASISPERIRGLIISVWFANGAEKMVSDEFWEIARMQSMRYKEQVK